MKKVIVIASAVIAILFAIGMIIALLMDIKSPERYSPTINIEFIIKISILLLTILISSLVIFNVKPTKILRILLLVVSIPVTILFSGMFVFLLALFIKDYNIIDINDPFDSTFIILDLGFLAVTITLLTYIRRALRKDGLPASSMAEVKENK